MTTLNQIEKKLERSDFIASIISILVGVIVVGLFFSLIYFSASQIDENKRTETTAESKH